MKSARTKWIRLTVNCMRNSNNRNGKSAKRSNASWRPTKKPLLGNTKNCVQRIWDCTNASNSNANKTSVNILSQQPPEPQDLETVHRETVETGAIATPDLVPGLQVPDPEVEAGAGEVEVEEVVAVAAAVVERVEQVVWPALVVLAASVSVPAAVPAL